LLGRRCVNAYTLLALLCGLLAIPTVALAASGGSGLTPSGGTSSGSSSAGVQPGNVTVSASGDGVTLWTNASTMLRNGLSVSGQASPSAAGKTVVIQRLGHQTSWQWAPTVTATVASDGSFTAVWTTNHIGRFSIRAVLASGISASAATAAPMVTITVYRPSLATWYGPGLYGAKTACGQRLTRNTIGVANRTLKCGTKVALYYGGRTMVVPVIDRGPYANGADWDLTQATAKALGADGVAKVGAVSLPPAPALPQPVSQPTG
jgi:rare lipoprotein A (peptidoglycan hydrolase)